MGDKEQVGPPAEKHVLEQLMGTMMRFQWVITLSCYYIQILVPWHLTSHGLLVPATTPIYCSNTNLSIEGILTADELNELYEEACSEDCPEIIVGKEYWDLTIVHQYKLYCHGRENFTTIAQMIVMFGIFVGNICSGYLSDNYGRKTVLSSAVLITVPMGVAVAFSPNIYCFLVFKFLLNVFIGACMVPQFVLFSECNGAKWRPIIGLLAQLPYMIGYISVAGLAYVFRDWRYFQLAISLPSCFCVYYIWVLPESPRWLLSVGQIERGIAQVEYIARWNRLPTDMVRARILAYVEEMKNSTGETLRKGKFKDLFRSSKMSLITLFSWVNWFAIMGCFYGMAGYTASLGSNIYQSFLLSGLTQPPSLLCVFYTLIYWGRRWTVFTGNLIACVSFLAITFTPIGNYQVIPASIGMFGLALSFATIYVYTSELFATPVRNLGMGSGSSMARVGAFFGAYVVDLRRIKEWIPPLIFAIALGVTLVGFIFLPETKGIILPTSVQSTENLETLSSSISRRFGTFRERIAKRTSRTRRGVELEAS